MAIFEWMNKTRLFFYRALFIRNIGLILQKTNNSIRGDLPLDTWGNKYSEELKRRLDSTIECAELQIILNTLNHLKIVHSNKTIDFDIEKKDIPTLLNCKRTGTKDNYKDDVIEDDFDHKTHTEREIGTYFLRFTMNEWENHQTYKHILKNKILEVYGNISIRQGFGQQSLKGHPEKYWRTQFYVDIEAFQRTENGVVKCGITRLWTSCGIEIESIDETGVLKTHEFTNLTEQEDIIENDRKAEKELVKQKKEAAQHEQDRRNALKHPKKNPDSIRLKEKIALKKAQKIINKIIEEQDCFEDAMDLNFGQNLRILAVDPISQFQSNKTDDNTSSDERKAKDEKKSTSSNWEYAVYAVIVLAVLSAVACIYNVGGIEGVLTGTKLITLAAGTIALITVSRAFINMQNSLQDASTATVESCLKFNNLCDNSSNLVKNADSLVPSASMALQATTNQAVMTMKSATEVTINMNKKVRNCEIM